MSPQRWWRSLQILRGTARRTIWQVRDLLHMRLLSSLRDRTCCQRAAYWHPWRRIFRSLASIGERCQSSPWLWRRRRWWCHVLLCSSLMWAFWTSPNRRCPTEGKWSDKKALTICILMTCSLRSIVLIFYRIRCSLTKSTPIVLKKFSVKEFS